MEGGNSNEESTGHYIPLSEPSYFCPLSLGSNLGSQAGASSMEHYWGTFPSCSLFHTSSHPFLCFQAVRFPLVPIPEFYHNF